MSRQTLLTIPLALVLAAGWSAAASAQSQARGQSAIACDSYASNYSKKHSAKGQMLIGGGGGALIGLGLGAIGGAAGVGAAIGGGIGLIGGGAARKNTADRMYNAAYQDCMAGRVR